MRGLQHTLPHAVKPYALLFRDSLHVVWLCQEISFNNASEYEVL